MGFCSNCGTETVEGAFFCGECGELLTENIIGKSEEPSTDVEDPGRRLGIIAMATSIFPIIGIIVGLYGLKKSTTSKGRTLNYYGLTLSFIVIIIAIAIAWP